jgi:hypothetical protein
MSNPLELLKGTNAENKNPLGDFMKLMQGLKSVSGAGSPATTPEIGPELAYKLAQAVARTSDLALLRDSITSLVDALDGINIALSRQKAE